MEKEFIERLVETEQRSKSNTRRLDTVEKRVEDIHSLTLSVKEIAIEVKKMREDINKMDSRLIAIEEKPAKRMDLIWGYIVSGIVGVLVGYISVKIGLK